MSIGEIENIVHESLDQAFDKVSVSTDLYEDKITITAIKDGKTAKQELESYIFSDTPFRVGKKLQDLKYDLLKLL